MTIHKHHKINFKNGERIRTDEVVELSVREHAEEHERLYNEGGHYQDKLAYQGLMGMISKPDIMKEIHKHRPRESYATYGFLGKKMSDTHKQLISKANKKAWASYSDEEYKARNDKVKGKKNGMFGKIPTNAFPKGRIPTNAIPVTFRGVQYKSREEAKRKTGVSIYFIMKEVKNEQHGLSVGGSLQTPNN